MNAKDHQISIEEMENQKNENDYIVNMCSTDECHPIFKKSMEVILNSLESARLLKASEGFSKSPAKVHRCNLFV